MQSLEKQLIPIYSHKPVLGGKTVQINQVNAPLEDVPVQERLIKFKDELKKKKADLCNQHEEHMQKICPFKPNEERYQDTTRKVSSMKFDELHSRCYVNPKQHRSDLTDCDIKFRANPDEYTFKPQRGDISKALPL
jgi:hypothetical protein